MHNILVNFHLFRNYKTLFSAVCSKWLC